MDDEMRKELDDIGSADNEGFPSFLFDIIYGVDENDNYYSVATEGSIPPEILEMKRKYLDYYDWERAVDAYDEYLEMLGDKYGGVDIVLESYNAGTLDEYLPVKPKLKPTKQNKKYLKSGIAPLQKFKLPEKVDLKELAETMFPYNPNQGDLDANDMYEPLPKNIRKSMMNSAKRVMGERRAANVMASSRNEGADLLMQIMSSYHAGEFDLNEKKKTYSFADEILDMMDEPYRDPDIEMDDILGGRQTYLSSGHMIAKRDEQQAEILQELYKLGIDFIGGRTKDKVVKLARKNVNYKENGPMTKKEMKKYKKRYKKERKMMNDRAIRDPALARLLTNNRKGFSDESLVSFSMSDVFRS